MPLVFVEGDLGGHLLGVSQNRVPFNVKFRFTIFGPMHSSMAVRADFWRFFISFLRAILFKWFLSPHVKHPSFTFLRQQPLFQLAFASFEFLILDCNKPSNNQ